MTPPPKKKKNTLNHYKNDKLQIFAVPNKTPSHPLVTLVTLISGESFGGTWRVYAVDGNQKSGRLVGWEVEGGSLSHYLPGLMHPKWWFSPDFWLPSTKWKTLNKQMWGWISRLEGTEINPPKMAMNLLLSQYRFPWDEDDRFVFLHLTQNF